MPKCGSRAVVQQEFASEEGRTTKYGKIRTLMLAMAQIHDEPARSENNINT